MTTTRKLEEIVTHLDDMSVTIEEIKDKADGQPIAVEKLDELRSEMTRATDQIEETLETGESPARPQTPAVSNQTPQE